jgi:hypothetical protein
MLSNFKATGSKQMLAIMLASKRLMRVMRLLQRPNHHVLATIKMNIVIAIKISIINFLVREIVPEISL